MRIRGGIYCQGNAKYDPDMYLTSFMRFTQRTQKEIKKLFERNGFFYI